MCNTNRRTAPAPCAPWSEAEQLHSHCHRPCWWQRRPSSRWQVLRRCSSTCKTGPVSYQQKASCFDEVNGFASSHRSSQVCCVWKGKAAELLHAGKVRVRWSPESLSVCGNYNSRPARTSQRAICADILAHSKLSWPCRTCLCL